MKSTIASTLRRIASAAAGLALVAVPVVCGDGGGLTTSPPNVTTVNAPALVLVADELTITSPAFADGAPIPAQFSCNGANVPPPLTWSAPSGAAELALVVDDPDAVRGYVHWIVIGIAPGAGSTGPGQTPAGGHSVTNSAGQQGYSGPCPPAGTGMHHYRFTLYQLPAPLQLPPGSAAGQAVQAIAQAAAAQARLTGTFQG